MGTAPDLRAGPAVVTGASRGIGRAVAVELCSRGFDVVATMRDPAAGADLVTEAASLDGSLAVQSLDVTRPDSIHLPDGLRVLVNNAAIDVENLPLEETPLDDWRRVFETNVFGLVDVTRRAIPLLRASGAGVICNLTSASLYLPMPFFALYRAGKAAVSALGESLRVELDPFGIRVIEVAPGPIDTDMLAGSSHLPEGVRFEAYRPQAESVGAVRDTIGDATTPAEEAARLIVDGIVDHDGPYRVPCDPYGAGLLDGWRAGDDESALRGMVEAFEVDAELDRRMR